MNKFEQTEWTRSLLVFTFSFAAWKKSPFRRWSSRNAAPRATRWNEIINKQDGRRGVSFFLPPRRGRLLKNFIRQLRPIFPPAAHRPARPIASAHHHSHPRPAQRKQPPPGRPSPPSFLPLLTSWLPDHWQSPRGEAHGPAARAAGSSRSSNLEEIECAGAPVVTLDHVNGRLGGSCRDLLACDQEHAGRTLLSMTDATRARSSESINKPSVRWSLDFISNLRKMISEDEI